MKDFFKSKGTKVAAALFAVFFAIIISSLVWGGRTTLFSNAVNTVTSPLRSGLSLLADYLEGIYAYMYDYDRLKNENSEMKAYIAQMEDIVRRSKVSNDENDRLRGLLNLKNAHTEMEIMDANVISWSASNWTSCFDINKGSNAGIEQGDCVITETGFLVGQVIEVNATTSVVRTLIDSEFSIGAIIDRNGISGIASGDFALMPDGILRLSYVPVSVDLLNGDTVLSSGKGEAFPAGLVIGKIMSEQYGESGLRWYGIAPSVELVTLTQVFIITEF